MYTIYTNVYMHDIYCNANQGCDAKINTRNRSTKGTQQYQQQQQQQQRKQNQNSLLYRIR